MSLGKMNWANLASYQVQPSDMELFQSYVRDQLSQYLQGTRTQGLVFGGDIVLISGLQFKITAGFAIMPDRALVSWPDLTTNLSGANATLARLDRIELSYVATNNTNVLDINSQSKVLDILNIVSVNINVGTPSASPVLNSKTTGNISIGSILLPAASISILPANISQNVGVDYESSALMLGNKNSFIRYNPGVSQLQFSNDGIQYQAFGSGGGGGSGGASWQPVDGAAPSDQIEYGEKSYLFSKDASQSLSMWIKVPSSYLPGAKISMKLCHYSPSSINSYKFLTVSTLVRKNVDSINFTGNQLTSTNSDVLNSAANLLTEATYDLTTLLGKINGVSVQPGDLINVQVQRVSPSATDDDADVRMIPSSTEVIFS